LSIHFVSQIMALTGLGLLFWGAIFFLISPSGFVDASVLISTVYSEYSTFDRITKDLQIEKSYYIPTVSNKNAVPEYVNRLKYPVVFISAQTNLEIPRIDDTSQGKFLLKKSRGVLLTPPGLGLMNLIERKIRSDLHSLSINKLSQVLSRVIVQDLVLAKGLTMNIEAKRVHLVIQNSIYKGLYNIERGSSSAQILG